MGIVNSIKFRASRQYSKFLKSILSFRAKLANSEKVVIWAAKSPRRSSLYYFLLSSSFDREHYSVLKGKLIHIKHDSSGISHDATLRRNIHRIEKGLTTIPLRKTFAQDYINETIYAYENMVQDSSDHNTLKWATDVLSLYFRTVDPTTVIEVAKKRFLQVKGTSINSVSNFIPYYRKDNVKSDIEFDSFQQLCLQRRSVRWYQDSKVPIDLIYKAVSAALHSPSACNRQPYRFVFVDDPEQLKIAGNLPMGIKTFSHNVPLIGILIGDLSAYFDERDRHIIYIDGGLAAMSFMFALETLGLSSCPINWPDIEERERGLEKFLKLKPHERGIMFFSIGYPLEEGQIPYSQKKTIDNIIKYHK
ncbi:nitroreductase family protein [Pontibacter beigongshangensis]|uniref:nitroreductase family protein n=1 Tax=Pontibacter beigongshangensis TaxID=2574733 RepID=UPI001650399A|nr:nitroreductase family protein [Pontibacter beigongshangensis]